MKSGTEKELDRRLRKLGAVHTMGTRHRMYYDPETGERITTLSRNLAREAPSYKIRQAQQWAKAKGIRL